MHLPVTLEAVDGQLQPGREVSTSSHVASGIEVKLIGS